MVRYGRVGLKCVAEDIVSRVCSHVARHCQGVVRINKAKRGSQSAIGNTGFGRERLVVENSHLHIVRRAQDSLNKIRHTQPHLSQDATSTHAMIESITTRIHPPVH